jgi:PAS domain S-box-containing protein
VSEGKSLDSGKRLRWDAGGIHRDLQRLRELESIINRGPAVVLRWRIADGWPVEFVSDNINQFGYTAEDLMSGRVSWPSITHIDDTPRLEAEIAGYLKAGRTEFGKKYRLVAKSRDIRWVEDRNEVVTDSDGVATHINGIVLDVTERKRAEEQLREKEIELAHVACLSDTGEMASGLAHELSEPLSAIGNYVQGAVRRIERGTHDSKELLAMLGEIAAETDRASETVHHFRRFVRKRKPCRSTSDVNELVHDALWLVSGEIRHSGIEVHLELQDSLPWVCVDTVQIRQCVLNLVRNALDAMREGPSDQRSLTVITRLADGEQIEVVVSDTGKGFAPDTSDRVFEPFFTTKDDGLGVGLSLTHSIVRAHGGRIRAISNPERGVTFKFTIPVGGEE